MTRLNVVLNGAKIQVGDGYVTSGSVRTVVCSFSFDDGWDGFYKTAVFFQSPKNAKYVHLSDTLECAVPHEVMQTAKPLYIGVFGHKDADVLSSGVVRVDIAAGAVIKGTEGEEPTPELYTQILTLAQEYKDSSASSAAAAQAAKDETLSLKNATQAIYSSFVSEESARVSAENTRRGAEQGRVDAEELREIAEFARSAAELSRAAGYERFTPVIAQNSQSIKQIESNMRGLNLSGGGRIPITTSERAVTFPKNAAQAPLKVALKGNTLNNLVTNGNFANGTANFNLINGTLDVVGDELKITGNSTTTYVAQTYTDPNVTLVSGHKYFVAVKMRYESGHRPDIFALVLRGSAGGADILVGVETTPKESGEYLISSIVTANDLSGGLYMRISTDYGSAAAAKNKVFYTKEWICIDLTAISQDTLSNEEMKMMTADWFSGEKSVIASCLCSVDKNGQNPTYLYCAPKVLRRSAGGIFDEISGGRFIARVKENGTVLPNPIVEEGIFSGNLISYAGGSVYMLPEIADVGVYEGGVNILYSDYRIKEVTQIKRIDSATGELTSLDVSLASIFAGGQSFSHSALKAGDVVFFTYAYDNQSVIGEKIYEYIDSWNVVADTANGKFYTCKPRITNGAIADFIIEEVV